MKYAIVSYFLWGILPLFWRMYPSEIDSLVLLFHRAFWAFIILYFFARIRDKKSDWPTIIFSKNILWKLLLTSFLIGANWGVYIWAVRIDRLLDASLGYFICPIIKAGLGFFLLNEELNRFKKISLSMVAISVLFLAAFYQIFPWVALTLATTVGAYALLHKVWGLGFELALKTETFLVAMLLLPVFLYQQSQIEYGIELTRLLPLAGLATLAPLLPYHLAIKRIDLSLLGFLQFIVPTINFVLAVFFLGEKFDTAKMIAFGGVWLAVAFFLIGERQSSDHLSPK